MRWCWVKCKYCAAKVPIAGQTVQRKFVVKRRKTYVAIVKCGECSMGIWKVGEVQAGVQERGRRGGMEKRVLGEFLISA